jgi:hypothetical protein
MKSRRHHARPANPLESPDLSEPTKAELRGQTRPAGYL